MCHVIAVLLAADNSVAFHLQSDDRADINTDISPAFMGLNSGCNNKITLHKGKA